MMLSSWGFLVHSPGLATASPNQPDPCEPPWVDGKIVYQGEMITLHLSQEQVNGRLKNWLWLRNLTLDPEQFANGCFEGRVYCGTELPCRFGHDIVPVVATKSYVIHLSKSQTSVSYVYSDIGYVGELFSAQSWISAENHLRWFDIELSNARFQKLHLEILQSIQSLQESLQAPVDPNVESLTPGLGRESVQGWSVRYRAGGRIDIAADGHASQIGQNL